MKLIIAFLLVLLTLQAQAETLATCGESKGYVYYPFDGLVSKTSSGFSEDATTGGSFMLQQKGPNDFDILFVDSRKEIISARDQGGRVIFLRAGENEMTFLVEYAKMTTEIYMFLREKDGRGVVQIVTSRGGASLIRKSSLMVAPCSKITYLKAE